jgi:hypothetical protein
MSDICLTQDIQRKEQKGKAGRKGNKGLYLQIYFRLIALH